MLHSARFELTVRRSEDEFRDYLRGNYIPEISANDMESILDLYPADITQGSPFDTGILNALTPQFKRMAAMQGDLVFQAPRRFFLSQRAGAQTAFAFCECGLYTSGLSGRLTRWQ